MGGGLATFWEEWNIQILVILSFVLQVILLYCAGIRRSREASAVLRILLWLAYLMADYTAIYALGHMSISMRRSPPLRDHQQMVPFWAPFLLLHLGGPDTITAYAFQDNELWLRHLLTLAAQVLGAAYVLYLFVAAGTTSPAGTLLAAAALMFVTGCLKYGERTWALKCGGIDSIASSLDDGKSSAAIGGAAYHGSVGRGGKRLDTEEVLLGAHYMLNFCKGLLADGPVMQVSEYQAVRQGIQLNGGGSYLFQLAAMELSLLYDILYTKAAVIHTWHGLCIRIVAPLSMVAALVLFQASDKDAYGRVDVAVTYVLLVGAIAVELASSLRAAGSSWACAAYHARGWYRLCGAVTRLRRRLRAGARRSACLGSLGQYNLLDLCTDARKDDHLRGKIAKMIGLGDRWQKLHYSTAAPISDGLKALVLGEIRKRKVDDLRNARGRWILNEKGMYEDLTRIADDTELDRSIIVWHIATDLYLSMCPPGPESDTDEEEEVRDSIRLLSNHMLFLMVVHPYLLPGVVRNGRYKENLKYYDMVWWLTLEATKEGTMKLSRSEIISKIADWQLPADSRHKYMYGVGEEAADDVDGRQVYGDGSWLAGMLSGNRWCLPAAEMLEVIAGVWVEMLCYASHHCGAVSHSKKLSTGGEFMNAVWLIVGHATTYDRYAPSGETLTGGLGLSNPLRKRNKLPARSRWMQPEADVVGGVDRPRPPGVPPGVYPANSPFIDVESHQTTTSSTSCSVQKDITNQTNS